MPLRLSTFGTAIATARKELRESQGEFARRFGVCRQTVARWEVQRHAPSDGTEAAVLSGIESLPPGLRLAILASMGAVIAPTPAQAPPAPVPARDPRAAMDLVVYRTAEALDVGPRRVRAALAIALREMEDAGLSVREAREVIGAA
jgi:hypothetical protein